MAKIMAICGKICCGKTHYSKQLKSTTQAIILSCDELTTALFGNDLGSNHDEITSKVKNYLIKKASELVNSGCNVILDWGFWSADNRQQLTEYCRSENIRCEWHYIDVSDSTWHKNIEERNQRIITEGSPDYYLDEGLMNKFLSIWEAPAKDEIDVWYRFER